jgi:hypothetical protein
MSSKMDRDEEYVVFGDLRGQDGLRTSLMRVLEDFVKALLRCSL